MVVMGDGRCRPPELFLLAMLLLVAFSFASCALQAPIGAKEDEGSAVLTGENGGSITRIAFGSCRNQSAPQPVWDSILAVDPQVFIWLGDNIYADQKKPLRMFGPEANEGFFAKVSRFRPVSPKQMQQMYDEGRSHPRYQALQERAQVIGTWDDHDYGLDDSGKELPIKHESIQLMLDFLGEPQGSPRRRQDGVYTSYTYGPSGRRIKVLLLDTRFNRDPHFSDGTILGSKQWNWLEKELRNSDAQIHIIGSSIQVVSNLSALVQPLFTVESWGRFPSEQRRLFDLIASLKVPGLIFISGDVHFTELSRYDCSGVGYPLYDLTSSGLTQSAEVPYLAFLQRIASTIMAKPMRVLGQPGVYSCRYHSCVYGLPNFGLLEIDWNASPPTIDMQTRDVHGRIVLGRKVTLEDLQPGAAPASLPGPPGRFKKYCTREVELPWLARYRLSIFFFSILGAIFLIPLVFGCLLTRALLRALRAKRKSE